MGNAYLGSKATTGLCQPLIALMPPHSVYIETHLGGGALMRRKPAALRNIGIDLDGRALSAFECDYPVELVQGCCHRFLADFPFDGTELVYSDPVPAQHAQVGAALPVRLRGGGPRGAAHLAAVVALCGDGSTRKSGRNFTHRQQVKRKAENWGRRYRGLPPAQRLAVLAALMAVEAE